MIDGQLIVTPEERFDNKINLGNSALPKCYGTGYSTAINNTMNLDLLLNQKLDFITKGLSAEIKGAYNTSYGFTKNVKDKWNNLCLSINLLWKIRHLVMIRRISTRILFIRSKEKIRTCNMRKLLRGHETGIWKQA